MMLPEITDLWMEQVQSQEMAEMLAFNLLQHVDYAPVIAYQWIASDTLRLYLSVLEQDFHVSWESLASRQTEYSLQTNS